jgi:hypothetical protein
MRIRTLDDFSDLSGWLPVASGQAQLRIQPDAAPDPSGPGGAMRLEFDFQGGGGFVVARKEVRLDLPESYAFVLAVRADAPANAFEFKLVDPSGANVWRLRDESFDFRTGWRTLRIPGSAIGFGWGPAGGGSARELGAIEIAVAAGPGGQGTLWVADLRLEDRTPSAPLRARASGARPGQAADCALDGQPDTCWSPDRLPAWLELDFREERDYGGLVLRWSSPRPRGFQVLAGDDGETWRRLYSAPRSAGLCSHVYLPGGGSRYLRLVLEGEVAGPQALGLVALEVQPESFSRSLSDFFHRLAADAPRGRYPRWLYREQSYWTPVDVPNGTVPALFNEEGMVEIARAGFSVEPFLRDLGSGDGPFATWADCAVSPGLVRPPLPIPTSMWTRDDLKLGISAFATGAPGGNWIALRYRVENRGADDRSLRLFAALRPFQVSPPWQGWRDIGGLSPVREVAYRDGAVWVNGALALVPVSAPIGFGAVAFDEGSVVDYLAAGELPASQAVSDPFGYASAALGFDLALPPGGVGEVVLAAPLGTGPAADPRDSLQLGLEGPERLAAALEEWSQVLGAVDFRLPETAQAYGDACTGSLAHILINRDGPALQPGPRRYTRSWIRDGATMAAALVRLGRAREAADFIRWYAPFQAPDGNVPCCVDREGPDWLPEHDSHGQLCFAVADYYRFTEDRTLVEELWPAVQRAVGFMERLRATRLTDEYRAPDKLACYGLLPESVSHEGYLAHPVHSYWDDLWALRGLKDAAELAAVVGDRTKAERLARLRDDFRATLHASIVRTIETRGIDFLPGSVEWADPDPTATANALTLIDEAHGLPVEAMHRSFDLFMERFGPCMGSIPSPGPITRRTRSGSSAPWSAWVAGPRPTSYCDSSWPNAGPRSGTSGPRSPGMTHAPPDIRGICPMPGSVPSTAWPSATFSPTSGSRTDPWWWAPVSRPSGSTRARSPSPDCPPGTASWTSA